MNLYCHMQMAHDRDSAGAAGFSLMECLAYLAVFFVVLGVAFAAYYQMDEQSRGLTRNSAEIVRALQAGERWRADVRAATNAVQFQENQEFRLSTSSGDVSYFFRDGAVWRQGAKDRLSVLVLEPVKLSAMQLDTRTQVSAWRWEIELKTKRTNTTTRPLFTFLAVPGTEVAR
jgi:type II secretory pathway component PulJ